MYNANCTTKGVRTSLQWALNEGLQDIADILIAKGVDVCATDEDGGTPLHYAALRGFMEIAALLIDKSVDVNSADKYAWTPLSVASEMGHKEIVKLLIEKGANVNAATTDGQTPLSLAKKKGHKEIVNLLITKGADEKSPDKGNGASKSSQRPNVEGIRVTDFRSDQEKQNEQDGRAGKGLPPETTELYELLVQARAWGRTHNWPSHDEYPQRQRAREIGELINNEYGFNGMQRVAYSINAKNSDLTVHLEQFWHEIGNWLA